MRVGQCDKTVQNGLTEKLTMVSPPQNTGGKFSLTNIHDRKFVAILARNFLQPRKIYVIDGDP